MTGKARGFMKGDFVNTGAFPAIIMSDVNTSAPCCEVWGTEHEMGSAYADDLIKLTAEEFFQQCQQLGYDATKLNPHSKEAKARLKTAWQEAV